MENDIFVNNAFSYAINEYLKNKDNRDGVGFNSFFVVVIRLLSVIYDELDIIGPYKQNDVEMLQTNLIKYGISLETVNYFESQLQEFYENNNTNSFINIQKCLIMFFAKKKTILDVTKDEEELFKSLLYTPYASNPLMVSYNFVMAKDPYEILNYYNAMMESNKKLEKSQQKEILNFDAYKLLNYSMEDINNMNANEVDEVNKKVFSYFDINENAINKNYLLDKALYDLNHPKVSLSTGNGYIDILFILAIISSLGLLLFIVGIIIF